MSSSSHIQDFISQARQVLALEAEALTQLIPYINEEFATICQTILDCKGKVIVTGMGKSGHIGKKIAATLASTGTPAFFLHPAEASHGDLGMISHNDLVLALSNSGEVDEIIHLLPVLKRLQIPIIAMTGNPSSTLATHANYHLWTYNEKEACPLGLAPTTSTTVALAMGDALAVALLNARQFTADDFARSHPGGKLGRRLLLSVDDIMLKTPLLPLSLTHTPLQEALLTMTQYPVGMTVIVDDFTTSKLLGVFTEGDLRRTLTQTTLAEKSLQTPLSHLMTKNCYTINQGQLAVDALNLMQEKRITALPVINNAQDKTLVGIIHMHHLLQARVV